MTIMKRVEWMDRPRANRLASVMYPNLADEQAKRDMEILSRQESKLSPTQRAGSHGKQGRKSSW
jgi:hypothetical protein